MNLALELTFKKRNDFEVFFSKSRGEDTLNAISVKKIKILVCDYNLDLINGVDLVIDAKKKFPDLKNLNRRLKLIFKFFEFRCDLPDAEFRFGII
ncbi:MAG: hypothetical protein ACXVCY_02920 [Pseudobdellovibrionaceae bacterium]